MSGIVPRVRCKTVLIVEDDPATRATLADILADEGYRCVEAAEGQEAIAQLAAEREPPCLILLDLMMPGMNGWQFREWQLAAADYAGIPVVVLSASKEAAEDARRLGAAAFLPKPVRLDALLDSVQRYCS